MRLYKDSVVQRSTDICFIFQFCDTNVQFVFDIAGVFISYLIIQLFLSVSKAFATPNSKEITHCI